MFTVRVIIVYKVTTRVAKQGHTTRYLQRYLKVWESQSEFAGNTAFLSDCDFAILLWFMLHASDRHGLMLTVASVVNLVRPTTIAILSSSASAIVYNIMNIRLICGIWVKGKGKHV